MFTRCAVVASTADDIYRRLDSLEKELQQVRQELRQRQASPSTHTTSPSVLDPAATPQLDQNPVLQNGTPENINGSIGGTLNGNLNGSMSATLNGGLQPTPQQDISAELVHGVELLPNVVLSLIEEYADRFQQTVSCVTDSDPGSTLGSTHIFLFYLSSMSSCHGTTSTSYYCGQSLP